MAIRRRQEWSWVGISKENESYFHFTLPESNRDELIKYIKTFGPVRMLKEKHPVVMPQGKIRIILILRKTRKAEARRSSNSHADEESKAP